MLSLTLQPGPIFLRLILHTTKKKRFQLRISSVNVTKSSFLRIWSHLLKKSLIENFIF